ncbi:thrombospondin type-1 domain-containing protein 4-like isoform X3 [Zootermopsis nevadensis]|nr:thrombospondin type-1 domain-containing protein 4-like isoform X3 [Zootermopsis nevadensis]
MFQQKLNRNPVTVGMWSSWSHWSPCTRSCGGGVAMQSRYCNNQEQILTSGRRRRVVVDAGDNAFYSSRNSTPYTKSHCVGVYKRFHICNDQLCPPGSVDFRRLQCETFNGKKFMGQNYLWEPFVDAPNKCELNCRPVGFRFYATLNRTAVDGTSCRGASNGRWVCVSGLCKNVGCDGVVGSTKLVDACGVCGGDNSTCRVVSGLFTRPQLPVGYNLIAQIPRGACNITISELKQSRNYLALRRSDGNYVINGNWAINWSGVYEAVGTRFTYRRQDANNGEIIEAPGPLMEPVDLMVIYQQPNPGIKYEYMLPMKLGDPTPALMSAPSVPRSDADNGIIAPPLLVPAGLNNPTDDVTIRNGPTFDEVDTRRSDDPLYPYGSGVQGTESQRQGNYHPGHQNATPVGDEATRPQPRIRGRKRKFVWKIIGYTECTKTCGGGTQMSLVKCVKEHNQQVVLDRRCSHHEKPLTQTVRCSVKPCPAEWVGGEWSECSVTCGEGIQKRDLMCKQEISPTLTMKVVEGACLTPPVLPRTQKCALPPCPQTQQQEEPRNSRWQAGQWGKCSVACGQGFRSRSVKCLGPGNENADDCPQDGKPEHEETCDMGHCPAGAYASWFYTKWTQQCSEDCGTGVQTRKVHCSGPGLDSCDASSKPDESRACSSDKQCSGKWFSGPWGQCSSGCGHGHQTRDVICATFLRGQYRVALDMNCPSGLRPETERPCEEKPCSPEWFFTDWTHCSRDCGSGVQKREVKCVDEKHQVSVGCAEDTRPPNKRICNTHECSTSHAGQTQSKPESDPEFKNGAGDQAHREEQYEGTQKGEDCDDKFRNCHMVVQARLCKYKYYRSSCCHSCHKKL